MLTNCLPAKYFSHPDHLDTLDILYVLCNWGSINQFVWSEIISHCGKIVQKNHLKSCWLRGHRSLVRRGLKDSLRLQMKYFPVSHIGRINLLFFLTIYTKILYFLHTNQFFFLLVGTKFSHRCVWKEILSQKAIEKYIKKLIEVQALRKARQKEARQEFETY